MSGRRLVVFDLETGGLDRQRHPITQFAGVALDLDMDGWPAVEECEVKIRFDPAAADPEALELGSYDAAVWARDAMPERLAADVISGFFRRHATLEKISARTKRGYNVAELCAYNGARFDGEFLASWFKRLEMFCPGACYEILDPFQLARWVVRFSPDPPPRDLRLASVAEWLGVESDPMAAHDALVDVRTTVEVARRLHARIAGGSP